MIMRSFYTVIFSLANGPCPAYALSTNQCSSTHHGSDLQKHLMLEGVQSQRDHGYLAGMWRSRCRCPLVSMSLVSSRPLSKVSFDQSKIE